jgi:site-specific recombinase XerD
MDLQVALQDFTTQLRADGRSPHTIGQYRRHVAALRAWLAANKRPADLAEITPAVLATFFTSDAARSSARGGDKKPTSANAMRTSLRNFCRWAHESGFVATNPARLLKRARCTPPAPRGLRADDQERLLRVLDAAAGPEAERDRVLITFLLRTGARLGSALALDVADLDLDHCEATLRRMKNDKTCTLLLPTGLAKTLRQFVAGREGPVFVAHGKRISTRHAQRRIGNWFAAAGLKGSAHALRHSFACDLLDRTGNLRLVQDALHHESVLSTAIYARVDRNRLREAVMG